MNEVITLAATTPQNLQAAGFFDWANNILGNVQAVIGSALVVIGMLVFAITAWNTKNVPGVIAGIIVGGIIMAAGGIMTAMSGVFSETVDEGNKPATASEQVHEITIDNPGQSLI